MSMTYVLQAPITLTNGVNTSEVEINDTTLNNIMNYINANASPDYIMQNTFDVNGNSLYTDANNLASQGQYFPLNYLNLIGVGPLSSYNTTVPVSSIEYYWLQVAKQLASSWHCSCNLGDSTVAGKVKEMMSDDADLMAD
jgi:hypothetical protein